MTIFYMLKKLDRDMEDVRKDSHRTHRMKKQGVY